MSVTPILVCTMLAGAPYAVDTTVKGRVTEELIPLTSAAYTRVSEFCPEKGCTLTPGDFLFVTTATGATATFRIADGLADVPLDDVLRQCIAEGN